MTLSKAYKQIMNRVQMTPEMKQRLLQAAADPAAAKPRGRAVSFVRRWAPYMAAAACLTVVALGGWRFVTAGAGAAAPGWGDKSMNAVAEDALQPENPTAGTQSCAPNTDEYTNGAMTDGAQKNESVAGYGGADGEVMAYSAADLVNANPWRQTQLTALPVPAAARSRDKDGIIPPPDTARMRAECRRVSEAFGVDARQITEQITYPDADSVTAMAESCRARGELVPEEFFGGGTVYAQNERVRVEVNEELTATVTFAQPVQLPASYRWAASGAEYAEVQRAAEYLRDAYADMLGMQRPIIDVAGGNCTADGQRLYTVALYEDSDDAGQRLLNYCFNRAEFFCNDAGRLASIRIYRPALRHIEQQPLRTEAQARALLAQGQYVTAAQQPFAGKVQKTELRYRRSEDGARWLPYYCFYAEAPGTAQPNGLKTYAVYFVAATDEG